MSTPTQSNKALKFALIVDTPEKRDVAIVNLPIQFLQTEMDEVVHLKVNGLLALFLVEHDAATKEK